MLVKDLLNSPNRWTKGVYARDCDGNGIASNNRNAVCWCLAGAINYCYEFESKKTKTKVAEAIKGCSLLDHFGIEEIIVQYNDSHEFEDIRKLLESLEI